MSREAWAYVLYPGCMWTDFLQLLIGLVSLLSLITGIPVTADSAQVSDVLIWLPSISAITSSRKNAKAGEIKKKQTNKQRGQMWEGIALRKIFQGRCLTHLYRFSSLCDVNSTSTLTSPWQPSYDSNVFPQISRSYYYLHLFIEFIITVNVIIIIIIFNTYIALFL